jgi:hypothetical protein
MAHTPLEKKNKAEEEQDQSHRRNFHQTKRKPKK